MADAERPTREPPAVSVVVPSFRGEGLLGRCLRSLAVQTLDPDRFEVVVVLNGPEDRSDEVLATVRADHPRLGLRVVRSGVPGAARARNLGLAAAAGTHVTFVDHDDWVSPGYLAALLDAAEPGVVPIAHVADVTVGADGAPGVPDFDNYIGRHLLPRAGRTFPVGGHSTALGFVAAKLVPTALARAVRFDEALRSGEDLVYWSEVYEEMPFDLHAVAIEDHAVYYRALTAGSVSRQDLTFDFSVLQRLEVIGRLVDRERATEESTGLQRAMVVAQTHHMAAYLAGHPEDHQRVLDEVERRGLAGVVPRRDLHRNMAQDLAVLYAFSPYADTSATVAARRIRARGVMVDVVSNTLDNIRALDPSAGIVADTFVGRHHQVRTHATAFWWRLLEAFCREGLAVVTRWVEEKGPYRTVYSRAMLPGSHLLAALVKLRWPETRWIAEFSDPMLWNPYGEKRQNDVHAGGLRDEIVAALADHGVELTEPLNAPHLVELIAYALADEIHFTNQNQMDFMLGYLPEQQLAERVRGRAVVEHHPTLPAEYYHRLETTVERTPGRINVAYFGAFYLTRGLTEIVDALAALDPEERSQVVLRVFTADPGALAEEAAEKGLTDVVQPGAYVPYLEFLNLTTRMDVLLVNDARTRQHYDVNPYLPSKWSDYAGSGTDIWAVVEEGSVLSGMATAYRSDLGDVDGAVAQLRRIIADHGRAASVDEGSPEAARGL